MPIEKTENMSEAAIFAIVAMERAATEYKETRAVAGTFKCPKCARDFHWQRAPNGHFRGGCVDTANCIGFIQ